MTNTRRSRRPCAEIKVLVADALPLFSDAIATALGKRRGLRVLAEKPASGPLVMETARLQRPDVALVDLWLPEMDGPSTAHEIGAVVPECKVIVLSGMYGPQDVRRALESGAVGFLPKSAGVDQVVEAIRLAAAGKQVFLKELAASLDRIESRRRQTFEFADLLESLSRRELEVLKLLSAGHSVNEVASQLFIAPGTAKAHIHTILKKTGAKSQAEVIAMAQYSGFLNR